LKLFRIESERLKLSAPFWRRIAESLDIDAAGQAAFHSCFDKIGREEGERDGHIDRSDSRKDAECHMFAVLDRGQGPQGRVQVEEPKIYTIIQCMPIEADGRLRYRINLTNLL